MVGHRHRPPRLSKGDEDVLHHALILSVEDVEVQNELTHIALVVKPFRSKRRRNERGLTIPPDNQRGRSALPAPRNSVHTRCAALPVGHVDAHVLHHALILVVEYMAM
jgi:hypothetical protein